MPTKPIIYDNVKEICSTHSSCELECAYVYICSSYLNLLAYLCCVLTALIWILDVYRVCAFFSLICLRTLGCHGIDAKSYMSLVIDVLFWKSLY